MSKKLEFKPTILKTKEELLLALKDGKIKSSKFNALDEEDQLFVEMVCFGGYKPGQAMKVIKPELSNHSAAGRRKMHNDNIVSAIDELTYKRDKYWRAELASSREYALNVMEYIMKTTDDEAVKLTAATKIVDAADRASKQDRPESEEQGGMTFNISIAEPPKHPSQIVDAEYEEDEDVIIEDESVKNSTGLPYTLNYKEAMHDSYQGEDEE